MDSAIFDFAFRRAARVLAASRCGAFASLMHDQIREGAAVLVDVCRREFGTPARSTNIDKLARTRIVKPKAEQMFRILFRFPRNIAVGALLHPDQPRRIA
jgi:hypothetical protein